MNENQNQPPYAIHRAALALLCASMISLSFGGCSKKEEVVEKEVIRPAKIMTVGSIGSSQTRKYPGKVRALDRVELSFEVSGKLIKLQVKSGQR